MVRAGRMEAHDFEALLQQVAEEVREPRKKNLFENEEPNLFGTHEIGRWYLKETETDVVDTAESAKEDEAAEVISRFMRQHLKKNRLRTACTTAICSSTTCMQSRWPTSLDGT